MSWKSLLVLGVLILPTTALAQNQNKQNAKTQPTPATPGDYKQLAGVKQIAGTLVSASADSRALTLRVTIPQIQPNPNYRPPRVTNTGNRYGYHHNYSRGSSYNPQQHMAQMMSRYQQIMRQPNPVVREQEMMQLAMQMQQMEAQAMMQFQMQAARLEMQQMQQMGRMMQQLARMNGNGSNGPYKVTNLQKDFDLELADGAVVRKLFTGTEYDDLGNLKQFTKAELAEMKGKDLSLPGYTAKAEDLQPGQEVILYLRPPAKAAAKNKGGLDAAVAAAATSSDRPTVRMIVMAKELNPTTAAAMAPANKKKK